MEFDPIGEAIDIFLKIKKRLNELENLLSSPNSVNEIRKKLRTRSREVPEMIIELGLVSTLSFCLAKAEMNNLSKIIRFIRYNEINILLRKQNQKIQLNTDTEKLAYAIYTYIILAYLEKYVKTLKKNKEAEITLNLEQLASQTAETNNIIYEYLNALLYKHNALFVSRLLQPYLLQFKRLCEAEFPSER